MDLYVKEVLVLPAGQRPIRIDKLLCSKLSNISRMRVQAGIRQGNVRVNGGDVKVSYQVRPMDKIEILLPYSSRNREIVGEDLPLDIVYEDEALVVVNKKASMVVHPAHENWTGTLVNGLLHYFGTLPAMGGDQVRPGLVHRIDKGTSGLLVVAKTEDSLAYLAHQFYHHTVGRHYIALVWGDVEGEEGTIDKSLGRSSKDRRVMTVYEDGSGKQASTDYEVIKRFGYVTMVGCKLGTGRTHQIRAHMKYLGHPLFGDMRYGGDRVLVGPSFAKYKAFVHNCFKVMPHQALHAASLSFEHPLRKERMSFEVELPNAFKEVVERWERYSKDKRMGG